VFSAITNIIFAYPRSYTYHRLGTTVLKYRRLPEVARSYTTALPNHRRFLGYFTPLQMSTLNFIFSVYYTYSFGRQQEYTGRICLVTGRSHANTSLKLQCVFHVTTAPQTTKTKRKGDVSQTLEAVNRGHW
jgi:hypothetical protein